MKTVSSSGPIAFLGDYLPRKCGIATFTSDLLGAVAARHRQSRCFAVPFNNIEGCYQYSELVRFEIEDAAGRPAATLALLRGLRAPVVTTLHALLRTPNADQRRVMQGLIERSTRLVVMTERGQAILQEVYQAPPAQIDLIRHGIPDVPFVAPRVCCGETVRPSAA